MQILFILATALGLIVVVFAVQNATPVTVRFLHWRLDSSVAVVTVLAVGAGAVIAWLLSLTSRLMRWRRSRSPSPPTPVPPPPLPPGS
jgi:putative membrane protein